MAAPEGSSALSATGSELDPAIERFARELEAAWGRHGALSALSPEELRRVAEEVRVPWRSGGPEMASITEHALPAGGQRVRVRIYNPGGDAPAPALIYLHGGGWTIFSLDTHDRVMREYASRAGVVVIGVDYALSPEAKYPVALDQVIAVAKFAAGGGIDIVDPRRIAIGGDSAGGNLALAAALRLRDERRGDVLRAILLNYGVFDRHCSPEAIRQFGGEGNMLTNDEMEGFWRNYLRDERDADQPWVSPIVADLRDLPPVFLTVAERDLLTEQSLRLADRLRAAGVSVRSETYPGTCHSFLEAVSIAPVAGRAFDDAAGWLRMTLFQ